MRQAAVTFARQVEEQFPAAECWDVLFCSDMLNLAEFFGLSGDRVRRLPTVVYFHENQITYPVQFDKERDFHFGLTNITTALAAKSVWFNSRFHLESFLSAMPAFLNKMPDFRPHHAVEVIRRKSVVEPPGILAPGGELRAGRTAGPLRILWAARWEHDKDPETFFQALRLIRRRGVSFRLLVLGESFRRVPEVFEEARGEFADAIDAWGHIESRDEYWRTLASADVVVSTARHEFFGLAVLEAIAAGAYPLLPDRLSYPELLGENHLEVGGQTQEFFYRGGASSLAEKLERLTERLGIGGLDAEPARRVVRRFDWSTRACALDDSLEGVAGERRL